MKGRVVFVAAALFTTTHLLAQTGKLNIVVEDPSGLTLVGAQVGISSRPIYDPNAGTNYKPVVYNTIATTNSSGIASFDSVPVGAYVICAAMPQSNLIDSCTFSEHPPSVVVGDAKSTASTVSLVKGALLQVIVNDSAQLLISANKQATGARFQLGVAVPKGPWRPFSTQTIVGNIRTYSLLVPVDVDLKLQIGTNAYKLADSSGKVIGNRGSAKALSFHIPKTSSGQTIQLAVVGTI